MRNETITVKDTPYIRVSKKRAEKLFNAGITIYFVPSNMRPGNFWYGLYPFNCALYDETDKMLAEKYHGTLFNKACNAYAFYNCTPETGKYIKFYVKEMDA